MRRRRALRNIVEAARSTDASWALVGGQALIAYGVPRVTTGVDAMVEGDGVAGDLAYALVADHGWTPLRYDAGKDDYVVADGVTAHYMDDKVLFDVGEERARYPVRSPDGMLVDLLSAQHPVEREMVGLAAQRLVHGERVPVASLGGVMLVKAKADRLKDQAALEQAAEFLPGALLNAAVDWAHERDPGTADDMRAIFSAVKARITPRRTEAYVPRRQKPRPKNRK